MPLAPIPRRITSPPPATVVHHWPLPLPRNELRAPKRMKPCPHPISRTLLFSPLSSCLEDAEDSTRSQRSSANSRCFETISPLFFSLSARENSSPEEKRNESKESKGMVRKERMQTNVARIVGSLAQSLRGRRPRRKRSVGRAAVESHEEWRHSITTGKTTAWEPAVPKQCETNGLRGRILVFRFLRSTPIDD